jgi:hypothetical protein
MTYLKAWTYHYLGDTPTYSGMKLFLSGSQKEKDIPESGISMRIFSRLVLSRFTHLS